MAAGMHLCKGHLHWANEPQIGTRRYLPNIHPVNRLLAPHFFRAALVISKSLNSLTPPGGMLHRATAFTAESLAAFFQFGYDSFVFKPWIETARDRGFNESIDDSVYPAWRDASQLNNVIHDYVVKYIHLYYKSDADIDKDSHLQTYWNYMSTAWPVPKKLTQQLLIDYCSNVIFYNSAWREQIGNVSGYARDPAGVALQVLKGTKPLLGTPSSNIIVAYITIMTQEKTPRLLGDWTHYFLDDAAKGVYHDFHNALAGLVEDIAERNKHREFPVLDYDPTYIKMSVSS